MQELEKILEELKRIKDGNRKEKLYAKYPPNSKDQEVLNAYSQGYEDGTDNFYNAAAQIIRKHMNDGWISVDERLPEEWEKVIVWYEYFRYGDYNRMYETYGIGWQYGGHWAGDVSGTKARCIAWQPLPEPCRLKQPETCKYTGGSCCWPIDQCSDCPNNPERGE